MRGKARSQFQKVINAAVRATIRAQADSGFIPQATRSTTASSPPQNVTTVGESEDGIVFTQRIGMVGIDTLGDPGALLVVQGNTKDYGS
jgi:hypothetical protein